MGESYSNRDLDLQIRVRSSKLSVDELLKITTQVVETLKTLELKLVDQNLSVNRNSEKTLSSITSTFQSSD